MKNLKQLLEENKNVVFTMDDFTVPEYRNIFALTQDAFSKIEKMTQQMEQQNNRENK